MARGLTFPKQPQGCHGVSQALAEPRTPIELALEQSWAGASELWPRAWPSIPAPPFLLLLLLLLLWEGEALGGRGRKGKQPAAATSAGVCGSPSPRDTGGSRSDQADQGSPARDFRVWQMCPGPT